MPASPLHFRDYTLEDPIGDRAGGSLYRALSPSENGGRGRRDLIYRAFPAFAQDVNAVDQLRDCLEKSIGVTHSSLLSPVTLFTSPSELVLVSEWAPSITLAAFTKHLLENGKQWPVPIALYLAGEIAKVLCFLQGSTDPLLGFPMALMHGQVRPENIFITFGGQVKLLGLGMATMESYALQTKGGFIPNRANYSSAEQAAQKDPDGRSDLFSLGVILWELITGRALFPACAPEESARILSEKIPPPPSQARGDIPKELDAVLSKLLDRDRHLRYELGEKAAQDMNAVLKFRFPEFRPSDFGSFCKENLGAPLEVFKKTIERPDRASDETKILTAPDIRSLPSATKILIEKPVVNQPREPAPHLIASYATAPANTLFSSYAIKVGGAIGAAALLALPFVVPHFSDHGKVKREIAQKKITKGIEKLANLHFSGTDSDYEVIVNGKIVEVIDGIAAVAANQDLNVVVRKPGFEEIQLDTQLMEGEDFNVPLSFRALR
jgi:serine/threonine protein kinase